MTPVYLAGAVRTPIGRFGGSLASWSAADLGAAVAKESLQRAKRAARSSWTTLSGVVRGRRVAVPTSRAQITFRAGVA